MQRQKDPKQTDPAAAGKQTDLAEGELETVEDSIRIHEERGDMEVDTPSEEKRDAA